MNAALECYQRLLAAQARDPEEIRAIAEACDIAHKRETARLRISRKLPKTY